VTEMAPVPRLALTREEAAAAVGMSLDSFERHVQPTLRLVRRGRLRLVPVGELERWLREWGSSFPQAAPVVDIDMSDQSQRWSAFKALAELDPVERRSLGHSPTIAAGAQVLRDVSGIRLVRTGWFRAHVRVEESISSTELANRMQRVGWSRKGDTGRIKATRPGLPGELVWTFYLVPKGWENQLPADEQVNE